MLHPSLRAAAVSALLLAPFVGALPASAANERIVGRAAATQPVHFFVKLPLRNRGELEQLISLQGTEKSPLYHHFITPKQFAAEFGPTAASRARVETALRAEGVTIDRAGAQGYVVRAASAAVEKNFGVRMNVLRSANGRTHVATKDPVRMPLALSKEGAAVVGLAYLTPRHTYARRSSVQPGNRYSPVGDYYFDDLKEAYDYPTYKDVRGRGVTIGVVISSDVLDSDTQSYFDHENFTKISHYPVPTVNRRYVEGGAPFDPNSDSSFEASLDVQQTLGSAPGATDLLYDIPDLGDDSILAGYLDVVEDNAADVISSSFGGCELDYTAAYNGGMDYTYILNIYDEIFAQGNAQGQTFLASSGDSSGLACPSLNYFYGQNGTFVPSVENPASDPHVTAVGGTDLVTTTPPSPQPSVPVLTSKYVRESEYGDPEIPYDVYGFGATVSGGYWGSGSGISTVFARARVSDGIRPEDQRPFRSGRLDADGRLPVRHRALVQQRRQRVDPQLRRLPLRRDRDECVLTRVRGLARTAHCLRPLAPRQRQHDVVRARHGERCAAVSLLPSGHPRLQRRRDGQGRHEGLQPDHRPRHPVRGEFYRRAEPAARRRSADPEQPLAGAARPLAAMRAGVSARAPRRPRVLDRSASG